MRYAEKTCLSQQNELTKVKLISFYDCVVHHRNSFILNDIILYLKNIGQPISNVSRLKTYLAKSRDFRKIAEGEYILTPAVKEKLSNDCNDFLFDEDTIISESEILDENLFCGKRGYLDKLIKQVNHCYQNCCYDACAVCMRRIFEITLILAYENNGIQEEIKKNGEYMMLEKVVTNAMNNTTLQLSRLKNKYNSIREIGNYAAHRILYNTCKKDIDDIKQTFRVCLEELYYKAGLLK